MREMVLPEELRVLGSVADYLRSPQRLRRDVEWCGIEPKYCDEILAAPLNCLSRVRASWRAGAYGQAYVQCRELGH